MTKEFCIFDELGEYSDGFLPSFSTEPPLPSSMATASQGPPLPQTNFQEIPQPAASVVPPAPKPVFPSQQQEVKVPQPAQLVKKKEEVTPKPADAKAVADKMDYDKLFGN